MDVDYDEYRRFGMFCATFFAILILAIVYNIHFENFKKLVKKEFTEKLISAFDDFGSIKMTENANIPWKKIQILHHMKILPDLQDTDDIFEGIYKNIHFDIVETYLKYGQDTKYSLAPRFKGIIFRIKGKCAPGKEKIIRIEKKRILFETLFRDIGYFVMIFICAIAFVVFSIGDMSFLGEIFSPLTRYAGIGLAIVAFIYLRANMSRYEIYDNSGHKMCNTTETNRLFRLIENIKRTFRASRVECVLADDNFILSIETNKDAFEVGNLCTSVYNIKTYRTFFNEISSFIIFLNYLKGLDCLKVFFGEE